MENPRYFSQCELCSKYHIGKPSHRVCIDQTRAKIRKNIQTAIKNGHSKSSSLIQKYEKCIQCLDTRIKHFDDNFLRENKIAPNKVYGEEKEDNMFLTSIGIDPSRIYTEEH